MTRSPLEIERKWLVNGWPERPLPVLKEERMRQGYISVEPTVRIREEGTVGGDTAYILCVKNRGNGLTRKETEIEISREQFEKLEDIINLPLVPKLRRTYLLPGGEHLEVNLVDEEAPTGFAYAEVEFPSEEAAGRFHPADAGLGDYLVREVTNVPGQTMGAYWRRNRLGLAG